MKISIENLKDLVVARLNKSGIVTQTKDRAGTDSSYITLLEYSVVGKYDIKNVEIRFSNHNQFYFSSLNFEFREVKWNTIETSKVEITSIVKKIKAYIASKKVINACVKNYSVSEAVQLQNLGLKFGGKL